MPPPSTAAATAIVARVGLPTMAYGVLYSWWLVGAGALVTVIGFMGWAMGPPVAE